MRLGGIFFRRKPRALFPLPDAGKIEVVICWEVVYEFKKAVVVDSPSHAPFIKRRRKGEENEEKNKENNYGSFIKSHPSSLQRIYFCYNNPVKNTLMIAVGISTTLILLVVLRHNLAFQKSGTIVLPAGGTYLGPSSSPSPLPPVALAEGGAVISGRIYPYSFEAPDTLTLVTFPNDPYDIYALSINNQPPEQNVLIGVDKAEGGKRAYVENWWKQFGGLKGVESITQFTNSNGLKGYKAKYINGSGIDVFFESPDGKYMIHLANGPLSKQVFDAIVDSVKWE